MRDNFFILLSKNKKFNFFYCEVFLDDCSELKKSLTYWSPVNVNDC